MRSINKTDKKGEAGMMIPIMVFIGIIFALAVLPDIASNQATLTTTVTTPSNVTVAGASFDSGGSAYALAGHDVTNLIVTNASGGMILNSANYTVTTRVIQSNGNVRDTIIPTIASEFNKTSVNLTYTYSPDGYVDDSAGRAIAGLIVLFTVLAIVMYSIPSIKEFMGFGK